MVNGDKNDNIVNGDKKNRGLNIESNAVKMKEIELKLRDSVPGEVDGEGLGVNNGVGGLNDCDKKNHELNSVMNEVSCVKDSLVVLLDEEIEDCADTNLNSIVITSGQRKKLGRECKKKRISANIVNEKVDANSDPDIDTIVPERKRGRPSKKRNEEIDVEKKVKVSAGGHAIGKKNGKATSTYKKKVEANADPGIDTIVRERKRGRPSKERNEESDVEKKVKVRAGGYAIGKKNGKVTSTYKKKVDVIVPKKKRGRPPKESRVEGTVKEKVRVRSGDKKAGDDDNAGDEETLVDMLATSLERKTRGRRNGLDDSERMECGEDRSADTYGDKCRERKAEKGRRGRKRKNIESSEHKSDDGKCRKKAKETSFDDGSEGVASVLIGCKSKSKNDLLSKKITGKMKEESTHLSDRRNEKSKELRERSPKGQEKIGSFKTIGGEKQKKYGLRKMGVNALSKKVVKDTSDQQKDASSSDGEGKKIVLEHPKEKIHEEKKEGMSRSTPKQIITDRIKDMLRNAGWTIERRPRNSKENCYDSVYVCPKGKGYWSVTLAYKILKQEVENGKADSKAVSAFVPIAEDEYNSLLRNNSSKKCKEDKDSSSKVTSRKKYLEKKHDKENNRLKLKHKEKFKKPYGKERKNKKRLALLSRGSKKGSDFNGEIFSPYKKTFSLLSWMIESGTVPLGVKVKIMNGRRSKKSFEGKVTKDGIRCDCCNKNFALADFKFHSGSSLSQPLQNICLDSETSLLQCLKDAWIKYGESMKLGFYSVDIDGDPNDDICNMCGDGGNLICCDSCPSAIHPKCLNIQKFPSGDWNCVYCSCKFCGLVGESTLAEDNNSDTSGPALPTCRLCDEKFHLLCIQGKNLPHNEPNSPTFCSQKCQEIFHQLEGLMGIKHQMEEGYSWTLIQHSDDNLDISSLSGANKVECNAKLAVAWSIMDECFLPIIDPRSGINMIHNVVFSCGSNFRRLNYTGFFTAILEKGDEIISAASLRIHGNLLAEMPFIGTRQTYRRQGMCRRLLNAIETALSSLNVEKLVLPAISEVRQTWTSVFGFMPLEDSHKKEMKCMNVVVFPEVDMLQKPVEKQLFGVENLSSDTVKSSGTRDVAIVRKLACESANCQESITNFDKNNKQENVPSGCCNMASNVNSKLNDQEFAEKENIVANCEIVCDPINCEMKKIPQLSDATDIVDCVLNGEINDFNQSRDKHAVNNSGKSPQALVRV